MGVRYGTMTSAQTQNEYTSRKCDCVVRVCAVLRTPFGPTRGLCVDKRLWGSVHVVNILRNMPLKTSHLLRVTTKQRAQASATRGQVHFVPTLVLQKCLWMWASNAVLALPRIKFSA